MASPTPMATSFEVTFSRIAGCAAFIGKTPIRLSSKFTIIYGSEDDIRVLPIGSRDPKRGHLRAAEQRQQAALD